MKIMVVGATGETGQLVVPAVPTGLNSRLPRADLATVLLDQLADPQYVHTEVTAVAV